MDEAASAAASGMAAILGVDPEAAESIAATRREQGGELWVANDNAPGQVVLAGAAADISWLVANARELGARRAIELKVAGAFHSPFMRPAADDLRAALDATRFTEPAFPVIANTTAAPTIDIADTLALQLVSLVRFADGLVAMADLGIEAFVHVGPGNVTAGMARRTVPDATVLSMSSLDDITGVVEALTVQ